MDQEATLSPNQAQATQQKGDVEQHSGSIEPKLPKKPQEDQIYFWNDCKPSGAVLNLRAEPDNNTLYTVSNGDYRVYKIDLESKKINFSGVCPVSYPEQVQSFSNHVETFDISTKQVKILFERADEESPVGKVFKHSYRKIEEQGGAQGQYLGKIDLQDQGSELELLRVFEILPYMISSKYAFMYSILKEIDTQTPQVLYYLGGLSGGRQENSLKRHFSLNLNFSYKDKKVAEKIKEDSADIDEEVKEELMFTTRKKVHVDDFPADPDHRYSTFTFIEDKALIATVFDFRTKKIVKRSIITVYEVFKALGFSSIYHSIEFKVFRCIYSFKQDRLFLNFDNDFEELDEDEPEHEEMYEESLEDETKPHVYLRRHDIFTLPRSFNIVIEGVSNAQKRGVRVLNNSSQTGFVLTGRDEVCVYNTVDFENKIELALFSDSGQEERRLVLDAADKINTTISGVYRVDEDHFVIADSNHFHLVDFNSAAILSSIQYKRNLDHREKIEDEDILVSYDKRSGALDLYRLEDENSGLLKHLYQYSIKRDIKSLNIYGIDSILGMKKINSEEILLFMKVVNLPRKNRRECEETLIELRLPLESGKRTDHRTHKPQIQRTPKTGAVLLGEKSWVGGVMIDQALILAEYPSLLNKGSEGVEEGVRGALFVPQNPDEMESTFLDYFFYTSKESKEEGEGETPYLFMLQEDQEIDEDEEFVQEEEEGERDGPVPILTLTKYQIEDFVVGAMTKEFTYLNSIDFSLEAEFRASTKHGKPLFFVYEKVEKESESVNELRVYDDDLKLKSRFDLSGFVLNIKSELNFAVLDENQFLVKLKRHRAAGSGSAPGEDEGSKAENSDEGNEVVQTFIYDLRTQKRRLLSNPTPTTASKHGQDVTSSPLMLGANGLVCFLQKGLDSENEKRESDGIHYYDLRAAKGIQAEPSA